MLDRVSPFTRETIMKPAIVLPGALLLFALCIGLAPLPAAPTDAAAEPAAQRIERLIRQLGHDEFQERERAQNELLKLGTDAFDALQAALEHEDIEVAARAQYLVRMIRVDWSRAGDSAAVKVQLKEYEGLDANTRSLRIAALGALPNEEGLSALCRIVRFEKTPLLAKHAALKILARKLPPATDHAQRGQVILDSLGQCQTPAAQWLRLEVRTRQQPEAAVAEWSKAVAAEETVLSRKPSESQNEIVLALLRRQVSLLEQLSRHDEVQATMIRMLDFEQATTETLPKLLDWLVERKAWPMLDQVAARFNDRIEQEPVLLYVLAAARLKQGQPEVAEKLAAKAYNLNAGEPINHWQRARDLQQRGMTIWAEREYQRAIAGGPPANVVTFAAQLGLSELLHDHDRHLDAAKALQPGIDELEKNDRFRAEVEERLFREMPGLRSRLQYFYARHHVAEKDLAKAVEYLDKAIGHDPTDADVLIALHRLPDQSLERRKKTLELIRSAAQEFRNQIEQEPEEATPYNQFAWLIGNTEGDQAEALRYSQKSLEITPGAAGYLDTLGRCYYASGDLDNALKVQTQAVQIEPHSGAMQRQLEFFKVEKAKAGKGT